MNSFVNQPLFPRLKQFLSWQEGLEVHLLHVNVLFNRYFCIIGGVGGGDTERQRRALTGLV